MLSKQILAGNALKRVSVSGNQLLKDSISVATRGDWRQGWTTQMLMVG
jgi:hypothetical protein